MGFQIGSSPVVIQSQLSSNLMLRKPMPSNRQPTQYAEMYIGTIVSGLARKVPVIAAGTLRRSISAAAAATRMGIGNGTKEMNSPSANARVTLRRFSVQ